MKIDAPNQPEKLKRAKPKALVRAINKLIDYAVATHIESIQFDQSKNEVISTPKGLTIKLQ